MKISKILIAIILILLIGCTESNTQTLNSTSFIKTTELINIQLNSWDRSENLLIGVDSNWVQENIIQRNEALLFSDKLYLSKDALRYMLNFIIEHSSEQFISSEIDAKEIAVIVYLYNGKGEEISFAFQKEKAINYIRKFIKYLRISEYNKEYDLLIRQLVTYDSQLEFHGPNR